MSPRWPNYKYRNDDLVATEFSAIQKSLIVGSLLGDGNLYFQKGCRFPRLSLAFSATKSTGYLDWKTQILVNFRPRLDSSWRSRQLYLSPHPYFKILYEMLYTPRPKHLSPNYLALLDELAVATWLMDDSSWVRHAKQIKLSTHSFSCQEHLLLQAWFEAKWGIRVDVKLCDTGTHCLHYLLFTRPEAQKLIALVRPHFIPDMLYKIGC